MQMEQDVWDSNIMSLTEVSSYLRNFSLCVDLCEYLLGTVWPSRSAVWDQCSHLDQNYSSCQLVCPPLQWKLLTKSFTSIPMDSALHPLASPHFLSLSLSHYRFPDLFVYKLSHFYFQSYSSLRCLFPTPISQYVFLISSLLTFCLFLSLFLSPLPVLTFFHLQTWCCWLRCVCRLFMPVSLKGAPMAS